MPRPSWLAIGTAAGSLALATVAPRFVVAGGLVAIAALVLVRLAVRLTDRDRRRVDLALAVAFGVGAIGLRAWTSEAPPVPAVDLPAGDGPWVGTVESIGAERAGSRPAMVRLPGPPMLLVAVTLPGYPPVVPSDRVELRGRIRPPPDDEYGEYLARVGAAGTLRAESLEILPSSWSFGAWLEDLRRMASRGLERALPEPEAGLATGVLIGLRDRVDRELAKDFTTAGASHVVAISGWNIAIVASTLAAVAGGVGRRRRAILTALAITLYVLFVGPTASVVRAGLMAGVALLARELGRPGTAAAALGLAVAGLLVLDPRWIDDAGFRLSVLATAGILAWGSPLTARLAGAEPGRPRRWVAEILGVSLAAQAATTPIVLLDFGRLSIVAPLVNLIVVPLVPPAMAAGALALIVGILGELGLPALVPILFGLPAWVLYSAMVTVVQWGARLPFASVELGPPWDLVAAAGSAVLILAGARWGGRFLDGTAPRLRALGSAPAPGARARRAGAHAGQRATGANRLPRLAALAIVASTIGLGVVAVHRPDGVARVVVLDVGQGDAILVESGRGGRMVVDGGPDSARLLTALGDRLAPWDRRIDILVLTHPHEDHVAGLARLLQRFDIGRVYEPGMRGLGPGYRGWSELLASGGPRHGRLSTGDRLALDQVRFRVLWPDPRRVPAEPPEAGTAINNVSIVLLGEVGSQRFLLAGDIEEEVDPELVARGLPEVDFLKVAHHGSRTSSTPEFLAATRPKVAVASAGAGNPYGHPTKETMERLEAVARRTYRTDRDGTIEVAFDGGPLRVRASGPRPTPKPRATPRPTASLPATGAGAAAAAFLCGIPDSLPQVADAPPGRVPPPPEAAAPPRALLGAKALQDAAASLPRLGRIAEPAKGPRTTPGYHPRDGDEPFPGDRIGARDRSPRLPLGRRRLWPRGRARGVPEGHEPLSRRPAGTLAAGRAPRPRPPPRRGP